VHGVEAVGSSVSEERSDRKQRIILRVAQEWLAGLGADAAREAPKTPAVQDEQNQTAPSHADRLGQRSGRILQKLQSDYEHHDVYGPIAKWEVIGIAQHAGNGWRDRSERRQHLG
jgi:hypothetical protein